MSEIQSLTLRMESLNQSVERWNTAMIWSLAFVAIAAIAVVVTTRIALARAKELATVQEGLGQAKERQLTLDLGDKDVKIADALKGAATANERSKILEHDNLILRNDTERLKSENLKVQSAVQPRRIIMGARDGDKETRQTRFKEVAKYAGTSVLVQSVPDFEAQTLAFDIRVALKNSGWTIVDESQSHITPGVIMGGVRVATVEVFPFTPGPSSPCQNPTFLQWLSFSEVDRSFANG